MRVGDKVINAHPDAGYDPDVEINKKHLKVGGEYIVKKMIVHNWNTEIFLKEFPGISFNSVQFETGRVLANPARSRK